MLISLEEIGITKKGEDTITFDFNECLSTLEGKLGLSKDDIGAHEDANALFLNLVDQMTLQVALPPIRRDGIGLNKDFIFNRLRGYIRKNETGAFKATLLSWLV